MQPTPLGITADQQADMQRLLAAEMQVSEDQFNQRLNIETDIALSRNNHLFANLPAPTLEFETATVANRDPLLAYARANITDDIRLENAVYDPNATDAAFFGGSASGNDLRYGRALKAYYGHYRDAENSFASVDRSFLRAGAFGSQDHSLMTNSFIVSEYANIGLEHPEFAWARLAAPVAYAVREGLLPLFDVDGVIDRLPFESSTPDFRDRAAWSSRA